VAHPDRKSSGDALKKRGRGAQFEPCQPVFSALAFAHLAAEVPGHQLLAVADAQHGRAELEDGGVDLRAPSSYTLAGRRK